MKKLGYIALILFGLIGIASVVNHQTETDTRNLNNQFQSELATIQKDYNLPGLTAAYIMPDGNTGSASAGYSDLETQEVMTNQSRMLAASIGKSFTAATAVALVLEEKLQLDSPISTWIGNRPWFPRLPNHKNITLRHLLNHSSGLPDHVYSEQFVNYWAKNRVEIANSFNPEKLVEFILDQPALFEAGQGWAYSDTNYILIGLIIEEVINGEYESEVIRRFIKPLNLLSTEPSNKIDLANLASGYLAADNQFGLPVKTKNAEGNMVWNPAIEWTGGGLITTPLDLVRWSKSLYDGKAIQGDYMPLLLQSVAVGGEESGIRIGLGLAIYEKGPFGKVYGHGGVIPGYVSSMRYYPEHRFGVAFQINTDAKITDGEPSAVKEIERRLAKVIFNSIQ